MDDFIVKVFPFNVMSVPLRKEKNISENNTIKSEQKKETNLYTNMRRKSSRYHPAAFNVSTLNCTNHLTQIASAHLSTAWESVLESCCLKSIRIGNKTSTVRSENN